MLLCPQNCDHLLYKYVRLIEVFSIRFEAVKQNNRQKSQKIAQKSAKYLKTSELA